jgi:hypothetical protein
MAKKKVKLKKSIFDRQRDKAINYLLGKEKI